MMDIIKLDKIAFVISELRESLRRLDVDDELRDSVLAKTEHALDRAATYELEYSYQFLKCSNKEDLDADTKSTLMALEAGIPAQAFYTPKPKDGK